MSVLINNDVSIESYPRAVWERLLLSLWPYIAIHLYLDLLMPIGL